MSNLRGDVEKTILARRLFAQGERILVAVSGGVDSMVLLNILAALARRHGWLMTAAHLNHQLRGPSSEADERLVRRAATALGIKCVVERAAIRQLARAQKLSLEMAARKARHEFLARTARQHGIKTVALAHHADDQVELFFLRLFRGGGSRGLAGMKWRSPSPADPALTLARPLLDLPKSALAEFARAEGIRFREDATNASLEIERNRIRHELLPLLRRKYQPALDKAILRTMEIIGAEERFVSETARPWLDKTLEARKGQSALAKPGDEIDPVILASITKAGFEKLPIAVQRRCLQIQLFDLGVAPEFELVERLRLRPEKPVCVGEEDADGRKERNAGKTGIRARKPLNPKNSDEGLMRFAGTRRPRPYACRVVRERNGRVRVERLVSAGFSTAQAELALEGGAGGATFDGVRVSWKKISEKPPEKPFEAGISWRKNSEVFDAERVGSRIVLRHWRPGDRFQPIGLGFPVKLQDFFINEKVPRPLRHELAIGVTAQGEVFWVEGMRISERFKVTPKTNRRLQWVWRRG